MGNMSHIEADVLLAVENLPQPVHIRDVLNHLTSNYYTRQAVKMMVWSMIEHGSVIVGDRFQLSINKEINTVVG